MSSVRIGVCTPERGGFIPWMFFLVNVRLAGGRPFRVTPSKPAELHQMDGLIVAGGADIDPGLYEQKELSEKLVKEARKATKSTHWGKRLVQLAAGVATYALRRLFGLKQAAKDSRKRDALEVPLIRAALETGVPVLGVCRGMQLINVVLGGTLHQEIADVYEDVSHPYTVLPHKPIVVDGKSRLGRIIGCGAANVNAMHHQAVNKLGHGLRVAAEDAYGIVEAIETSDPRFVIGVQWHPEFLLQFRSQRNIFKAFVAACKHKGSSIPFPPIEQHEDCSLTR